MQLCFSPASLFLEVNKARDVGEETLSPPAMSEQLKKTFRKLNVCSESTRASENAHVSIIEHFLNTVSLLDEWP